MPRSKPVIGVTLSLDEGSRIREGQPYVYLHRAYLAMLARAGAAPIAIDPSLTPADCASLCDGVVLSGGGDLPCSFSIADVANFEPSGEPENTERVDWERRLLDEFVEQTKPVLGVCYGMQLVCLHFGGRLHRDLADVPHTIPHGGVGGLRHPVVLEQASALLYTFGQQFETSSSHRQAVAELPPGFQVSARALDNVVEAFESLEAPLAGVQWHPESDETGSLVYKNFVEQVQHARRSKP